MFFFPEFRFEIDQKIVYECICNILIQKLKLLGLKSKLSSLPKNNVKKNGRIIIIESIGKIILV